MPLNIEANAPDRLADANLKPRGPVFPSPADWRDQVLYFLLPDRFSDGGDTARKPQDREEDPRKVRAPSAQLDYHG
jgi:hypothetical protein